jgi:ABC-2 type transport system permease protein
LANFFGLILNENMKIYRRLSTWIMLGIIVVIPLAMSAVFYFASNTTAGTSNWSMMSIESSLLLPLITIFTVVKASESVAGEFTWGTIKLLLIRPWTRSAILLSKYISLLLFALFFAVVAFIVSLLVNMVFFGYTGSAEGIMSVVGHSPWAIMLMTYGLQFISLIVIVSFGFMMSSAFRSSGLAIGLSIFFLLSGSLISALFTLTDRAWVKYVLFLHLDLQSYLRGGSPVPNQHTTLGFSIAVLAVYVVIFNVISWTVFRKRDVTA